jgi:hypothetical protein
MSVLDRPLEAHNAIQSPAVWCRRCGLSLGEAAIRHNLALVLAGCCPRCDGPLEERTPPTEPAIYLG